MKNAKVETEGGTSYRKTFFNLSVFQFLTFLRRGVFYTFMIYYLFKLMNTVTSTAALGTLNMVASSLGQNLLWGRICDKYKIRAKLIVAGETIAAFAYLMVFLVHRSLIDGGNKFGAGLAIIFGLSILEFFWSMSDVGWAALLTDITTPKVRGRVVGSLNFIASLGRMVGILYSGFLYIGGAGFENGTIFYIVIALLLLGAALMAFTSRRIKATRTTPQQAITPKTEAEAEEPDIRSDKTYRWFLASLVIIVLGAASINQIFLLFLQLPQGVNFTDTQVTLVTSVWTVGGMIASLAAGRLSDRFGRSKVLLLGFSLAIVTPLFYLYASTVPLMAFIYGLNGVSFWTIQTVGFVLAGDLIQKHRRGRLLSRYNTVIALSWGPAGILIGGPFADLQVQRLGLSSYTSYVNTFYASSIMAAVGTALFAIKVARLKHD
jgi:MFS family permease